HGSVGRVDGTSEIELPARVARGIAAIDRVDVVQPEVVRAAHRERVHVLLSAECDRALHVPGIGHTHPSMLRQRRVREMRTRRWPTREHGDDERVLTPAGEHAQRSPAAVYDVVVVWGQERVSDAAGYAVDALDAHSV